MVSIEGPPLFPRSAPVLLRHVCSVFGARARFFWWKNEKRKEKGGRATIEECHGLINLAASSLSFSECFSAFASLDHRRNLRENKKK